jgi:NDP-sugar pyrophosphorylase family protein
VAPTVAILAGGLATRLRPVTEKIPKAMLEVAGRPFIEWQLDLFQAQGFTDFVICSGYLGEQIESHLGNGASRGVSIRYSPDGDKLLGTAGTLRKAAGLLSDPCLVIYGDSYLEIDYRAVLQAFQYAGDPALMTVYQNGDRWDSSNVEFSAGRICRYDKKLRTPAMRFIDYGLSVIAQSVLGSVPAGEATDLADVFSRLAAEGNLAGFQAGRRFYEIGSQAGWAELDQLLASRNGVEGAKRMELKSYVEKYLLETRQIVDTIDQTSIVRAAEILRQVRDQAGRLFVLGVGGSAANASHAVNDFRKILGMEAYAPTDNVSELTARVNDESWESVFESWLQGSRLGANDGLLVFSVGGGSATASLNLVRAMDLAKERGAKIVSIVSRDGGRALQVSDACVLIPVVADERITPHAEGWQGVVWHLLVNAIKAGS